MTEFLPYARHLLLRIVALLTCGVVGCFLACTSDSVKKPEKLHDDVDPVRLMLQTQIRAIDSLYQIPDLTQAESQLTLLIEQEPQWRDHIMGDFYAWTYDWISEFYYRLGQLPEAKKYMDRAFSRIDSVPDVHLKAHLLNNRAIIEADLGQHEQAIRLLFEGMDLFGSDTVNHDFIDFYNNIGIIYSDSRQFDLAIQYYEKLMTLAGQLGLKEEFGFYHANLGHTHLKMGQLGKAIIHLQQARTHFIQHQQTDELLSLNPLIASAYVASGDLQTAENMLQGNLQETYEHKLWVAYVETTISLFELYIAKGDEKKAFEFIDLGLGKAHLSETARLHLKIYDKLIGYYRETGHFEHAFTYMQLYNDKRDSVQEISRADQMRELTVRYETDRKNDQISQLHLLHENEQRINRLYLYGLLGAILILMAIFLLLRRISIQKKALEAANRTKDTLFSIIAHDLRSPITALQGMGDLMNHYIERKEEQKLLALGDQTGLALGRVNHLLDNLLNWAVSNSEKLAFMPVEKEITLLLEEVLAVHRTAAEAKELRWRTDLQDAAIPVDPNMAFSIFHNIVSNAVKYAPHGSVITITGKQDNGYYAVSIEDEGKGIPRQVLDYINRPSAGQADEPVVSGAGKKSFGLGLRLVKSFVGQHKGHLRAENKNPGTKIVINLPLKNR